MEFQKHKKKDALTIEQQEGYIIALQDTIDSINRNVERYKDSLKWRKKFGDEEQLKKEKGR